MKWCCPLSVWIDSYKSIRPSHPPMLRILHDIESGVSWHRHALHETLQAVLAICGFFHSFLVFHLRLLQRHRKDEQVCQCENLPTAQHMLYCYTFEQILLNIRELFRAHPLTHFYSSCFSFFAFLCSSFRPCLLKMYCKIPFRCRGIHAQSVTPQPMP